MTIDVFSVCTYCFCTICDVILACACTVTLSIHVAREGGVAVVVCVVHERCPNHIQFTKWLWVAYTRSKSARVQECQL